MNKYSCENYLKQYHEVYGVNYCILRICVPYGTMIKDASSYGTAEFMLNKAAKGEDIVLFGDGLQKRTLIDMIDLCDIMENYGDNTSKLNIGEKSKIRR